MRPILKELSLEAYQDVSILNSVAAHLDNLDMKKVKMALKYFPLAAALTYFVGTLAFLNMIKQNLIIILILLIKSMVKN